MPFLITQLEEDLYSNSDSEGEGEDTHGNEWLLHNVPQKGEKDWSLKKLPMEHQPSGPNRKKHNKKEGKENTPKQPPKKHSNSCTKKTKKRGKSMDGKESLVYYDTDSYEEEDDAKAFSEGNKYHAGNLPAPHEGANVLYKHRINRSIEFNERTESDEFNSKFLLHILDDGGIRVRDQRRWYADNHGVIRKRTKPNWEARARQQFKDYFCRKGNVPPRNGATRKTMSL